MGAKEFIGSWPVLRQLTGPDRLARGAAASSPTTQSLQPRTVTADRVVKSVCPFCAVGCGQNVYVKDEKVVQIEGDPDSPIRTKCQALSDANRKVIGTLAETGALRAGVDALQLCRLVGGVATVADQSELDTAAIRPLLEVVADGLIKQS